MAKNKYALFQPHSVDCPDEDVLLALPWELGQWTKQKWVKFLIHAICPIAKGGRTVQIHVWHGGYKGQQ